MLDFTCSNCGNHVFADNSFAGKHVLCSNCNAAVAVSQRPSESPAQAIAASEHAAQAKIAMPGFREEAAPLEEEFALPSIRKDFLSIIGRFVPTLVVVGIVATLVGLLFSAADRVGAPSTRRLQCINNLKNIGLAVHAYNDVMKGMPPADTGLNLEQGSGQNPLCSLLPLLDQEALHQIGMQGRPFSAGRVAGAPTGTVQSVVITMFRCPSDHTIVKGFAANQMNQWAGSSYAANWQVFGAEKRGLFGGDGSYPIYTLATIPDGSSNVMFFTERLSVCGRGGNWWAASPSIQALRAPLFAVEKWDANWFLHGPQFAGEPNLCDPARASSPLKNGINVCMGDATIRSVPSSVSVASWVAAIKPDDGNVPGDDFNVP